MVYAPAHPQPKKTCDVLDMELEDAKVIPKLLNFEQKPMPGGRLLNEVDNDTVVFKRVITCNKKYVYEYGNRPRQVS